jgi:hypothetical protein
MTQPLSGSGRPILNLTRACVVVALTIGAVLAPPAAAQEPGPQLEASLLPSMQDSLGTPSSPSDALYAKQLAVLTSKGIPPARAMHALDVQGEVARAGLVSSLQASMAGKFAGVWFEPAQAKLYVGATSSQSAHNAQAAAERAGLSAEVAVAPVRSTMAELLATQKQWDHKLAALFAREEVETGLEPQRNAVSVTLSSLVPAPERAALEREATAADVTVYLTVAEGKVGFTPQAKTECETFTKNNAFCNRSITAGVSIGACTAGPLAINEKKERVLLTAGHCIGKVGENWSAKEIAGAEKVIGPVIAFANGGAAGEKKGDYADILIEAGWQTGKPAIPVFAVTAEWKRMNEKKEKTSYPVREERVPVAKNTNCHVGQVSGGTCGEIKMLNVSMAGGGKVAEGLVEDAGQLISEGGDSGGPWLVFEGNEALMEGSHVGRVAMCEKLAVELEGPQFFKTQVECSSLSEYPEKVGNKGTWERKAYKCVKAAKVEKGAQFFKTEAECKNNENAGEGEWKREPELHTVYQPLRQPVGGASEGSLEALKLELLTTANEVLPAAAIKVLPGDTFPVTVEMKSGEAKFETLAKTSMTCTSDVASGEFENGGAGVATITYTGCKSSGVGCRSENAKGEKDAVETILVTKAKLSVVNLKNTKKELAGGIVTTLPETIKALCGLVKDELRGSVLGLITPINKEVLTSETLKLELKQKEGVQEAGECQEPKETCEKLTKEPFEVKLGEKFSGAGVQSTETISLSKMVEVAA